MTPRKKIPCAGCKKDATHWIEVSPTTYQEHCTDCMLDAMCAEPVRVIHIESLEVANRGIVHTKSA